MLEGLHDTAIELIAGESGVDFEMALPPQPERMRAMSMPGTFETLRDIFVFHARRHRGTLIGCLAAGNVSPTSSIWSERSKPLSN